MSIVFCTSQAKGRRAGTASNRPGSFLQSFTYAAWRRNMRYSHCPLYYDCIWRNRSHFAKPIRGFRERRGLVPWRLGLGSSLLRRRRRFCDMWGSAIGFMPHSESVTQASAFYSAAGSPSSRKLGFANLAAGATEQTHAEVQRIAIISFSVTIPYLHSDHNPVPVAACAGIMR